MRKSQPCGDTLLFQVCSLGQHNEHYVRNAESQTLRSIAIESKSVLCQDLQVILLQIKRKEEGQQGHETAIWGTELHMRDQGNLTYTVIVLLSLHLAHGLF